MPTRVDDKHVIDGLKRLKGGAGARIQKIMGTFAADEEGRLKDQPYPSKRGGQDYSRTRQLASNWQVETQGFALEVSNQTPYAHWVVDEQYQAWMHSGRWWIVQEVVQEHTFELLPEMIAEGLIELYEG